MVSVLELTNSHPGLYVWTTYCWDNSCYVSHVFFHKIIIPSKMTTCLRKYTVKMCNKRNTKKYGFFTYKFNLNGFMCMRSIILSVISISENDLSIWKTIMGSKSLCRRNGAKPLLLPVDTYVWEVWFYLLIHLPYIKGMRVSSRLLSG